MVKSFQQARIENRSSVIVAMKAESYSSDEKLRL